APDQKRELYAKLVSKVTDASTACGRTNAAAKRLAVAVFSSWLLGQAKTLAAPTTGGRGGVLETKFQAAGFAPADDTVESAKQQSRSYRQRTLQPGYLDLSDRQAIESEVEAALARLRGQLDAGKIQDTGAEFHSRCLEELKRLRDRLPTKQKPLLGH